MHAGATLFPLLVTLFMTSVRLIGLYSADTVRFMTSLNVQPQKSDNDSRIRFTQLEITVNIEIN